MKLSPQKSFVLSVITAIVLLIIFSSCVTERQRQRILKDCVTNSTSVKKDSTWQTQLLKHDTVYKSVPGPIRYFRSVCDSLCDENGKLKPFKSETKKNGIKQSLTTVGDALVQECDVDSLLQVNSELQTTINHLITTNTETQVHENCLLEHITDADIFYIRLGKIAMWLVIAYILLRIAAKRWPWLAKFII